MKQRLFGSTFSPFQFFYYKISRVFVIISEIYKQFLSENGKS